VQYTTARVRGDVCLQDTDGRGTLNGAPKEVLWPPPPTRSRRPPTPTRPPSVTCAGASPDLLQPYHRPVRAHHLFDNQTTATKAKKRPTASTRLISR
jgi:hypothetical protein